MFRGEVRIASMRLQAETAPVRNPARTNEIVGEVALGTAPHADTAVTAAHEAFASYADVSGFPGPPPAAGGKEGQGGREE